MAEIGEDQTTDGTYLERLERELNEAASRAEKKAESAKSEAKAVGVDMKEEISKDKLMFDVVPWQAMYGVTNAMLVGACKYGSMNFREQRSIRASLYFNSTLRHLFGWWEGEDVDAESGLHPLDHAIAGLLILRDSMLQDGAVREQHHDDRPRPSQNKRVMEGANYHTARILKGFGSRKEERDV